MIYTLPILIYTAYVLIIEQNQYLPFILILNFYFLLQLAKSKYKIYVQVAYIVGLYFFPPFIFGMPLMLTVNPYLFGVFILITLLHTPNPILLIMMLASFSLSLLIDKKKTTLNEKEEIEVLADLAARESQQQLEIQSELSILAERERIARDIHDGVGHLLSAAILQLGALQAINADPDVKELSTSLDTLLQKSMNSMRESVHGLYAESINFEDEIQQIIQNSAIDTIHFSNEITKIKMNISQLFLWIIKEAQTNTQKHSDASVLSIKLFEDENYYNLLINDNGTSSDKSTEGLGLNNIHSRVKALNGLINISNDNGFRIFVKIPKEQE